MYPLRKTWSSIKQANLFTTMLLCALLAGLVLVCSIWTITWITDRFVALEKGWLDTLLNWIVALISGVAGWFVLPALTVLISSLFQESVIQRVERLEYPQSHRNVTFGFWPELWHDIKFTAEAIGWNILVLPCYFLGIGFPVSILLNAYLLGREFFESAAGYHLGKTEARILGKHHWKSIYIGGLTITVLSLIPLINLFVPIFAVVWMVHLYHAIQPPDKTR
ncbi:EI24 domain-containing protein [Desulfatirhabdium butyrativorans]|uniref:EI24 domain-containing protein n=1 Tax=Desulfatirhabdium butyrativorans TaxID=340467 RepID=UPI0006889EA5|nr:EI24 domain-containing protein [Desulfatirhabdium butyrativorans]